VSGKNLNTDIAKGVLVVTLSPDSVEDSILRDHDLGGGSGGHEEDPSIPQALQEAKINVTDDLMPSRYHSPSMKAQSIQVIDN